MKKNKKIQSKKLKSKDPKVHKWTLLVSVLFIVAIGLGYLYSTKAATGELAYRRYKINLRNVGPSWGHIGLDSYWKVGGENYVPCHHQSQYDEEICELKSWGGEVQYQKVYNFGAFRPDTPHIESERSINSNAMKSWPVNIIQGLEIYSTPELVNQPKNSVGNIRVEITRWSKSNNTAENTTYYTSPNLGELKLPTWGDNTSSYFSVNARLNGENAGDRLLFDVYGQTSSSRYSTTRYPVKGYFSDKTNTDGYLLTAPLIPGRQLVYVSDTYARLSWQCDYTNVATREVRNITYDLGNVANLNRSECFRIATVPHVADLPPPAK